MERWQRATKAAKVVLVVVVLAWRFVGVMALVVVVCIVGCEWWVAKEATTITTTTNTVFTRTRRQNGQFLKYKYTFSNSN